MTSPRVTFELTITGPGEKYQLAALDAEGNTLTTLGSGAIGIEISDWIATYLRDNAASIGADLAKRLIDELSRR